MKRWSSLVRGLLSLVIAIVLLSACAQREVELPFETIEMSKLPHAGGERYVVEQPKLVIVATSDEVSSLSPSLSPETGPELSNTDYSSHFVIAVFQGLKRVYDYEARIERITYVDDTVKVYTQFVEPTEGQPQHLIESSPYHIVRVRKPRELTGKQLRFMLVANGQEVLSENHPVP